MAQLRLPLSGMGEELRSYREMISKLKYLMSGHKALPGVLCLLALSAVAVEASSALLEAVAAPSAPAQQQAQPKQPNGKEPNRIHLLHANTLEFDKDVNPDFQILRGDVRFRQDSAYMYCDSAYFYEATNSLDAFGNVRMEQGDTLFIRNGDVLFYNGNTGLARLRGDGVQMINRADTLTSDSLNYDRVLNVGYFFDGGVITDPENRLSSRYGEYNPDTKLAVFKDDVKLVNPKYVLTSDTLQYYTSTGIAYIVGPSKIVSDSNTIVSDYGWYDTRADLAMLLDRSTLYSGSQTLTGDTLYYNRKSGYGEVFGNMVMNDTVRKLMLEGNYGFYNELTEYAFVSQRPLAVEYSSGDSLFLHADTLKSVVVDSCRQLEAYYGVRFYRSDLQGVCDSLKYSTADSTLVMYTNPVVWNLNYQIYGDTIFVTMNDSTIRHALIKDFAFLTQWKEGSYYDQLSGKEMNAYFVDGELDMMRMDGNVETIFYPEESDKSLIGLNKAESSYLQAWFVDRKIDKISMWPKVTGSLTPIPKLSPEILYLANFHWYDELRPKSKDDIYRLVKMSAEEAVTNTRLFSREELEGGTDDSLPQVEAKVRKAESATNKKKETPVSSEEKPTTPASNEEETPTTTEETPTTTEETPTTTEEVAPASTEVTPTTEEATTTE